MTWDGVERRKASYRRLIDCHPDFPCGDKNCVEPHPQRDLIAALRTPASGPGWTRENLREAFEADGRRRGWTAFKRHTVTGEYIRLAIEERWQAWIAADIALKGRSGAGGGTARGWSEFQSSVTEWADATFPGSSLQSKIAHAHKELDEILSSNGAGQAVEFADVFMILCHAASMRGFTTDAILDAAWKKLAVNKMRQWGKPDADGVVEHVRDEPAPTVGHCSWCAAFEDPNATCQCDSAVSGERRTAQSAPYNAESRSGNPYYERARVGDCPPEVVRDQRGAVCGTTCPTCGDSKTVMVREGAGGPIVATAPCPACTQPAREEGAAIESHPVRIRGGVDRAPQNPAGSGESGVAPHLGHFTEPSGRNQSGEAPSNRIWHLKSDLSSWGPACGRELASDGIAYTPSGVTCKECRAIVEAAPPITPPAPASRGEGAASGSCHVCGCGSTEINYECAFRTQMSEPIVREVIDSWKIWHRDLVYALGLKVVERKATLDAVNALVASHPPATAEVSEEEG